MTVQSLAIRQQKEMLEVFAGWETHNRYMISDPMGRQLYYAAEVKGGFFRRQFLGAWRPFTIHLTDTAGQRVLTLERPFRWVYHRVGVSGPGGQVLGAVEKRFTVIRNCYRIFDAAGLEIYTLLGPVFKPWTFYIQQQGRNVGKIAKKWSGLLKEGFTDADNFGIEFPPDADESRRAVLLGAVFLIDFVHFESKNRG